MTATADMILERRRVRRRLAFWRILAVVAVVVAVIAVLPGWKHNAGAHVARVTIDGVITGDPDRDKAILAVAKDDGAKALLLRVNSPGGTVVASENIYEAVRKVAANKPVVVVMDEVAASGGYVAALAGERIFARGNTLTGSIGVLMEAPNVAGLLDKLGVGVTRIKSAPLKAEPSLTSVPTPEAIAAQQALIADTFGWFRGLVAERRGLKGAALDTVTDGRAFTGRQALELGLIDALGDEDAARDWLAEAHGIDRKIAVVEQHWQKDELPWPLSEVSQGASMVNRLQRLVAGGPRLFALLQ